MWFVIAFATAGAAVGTYFAHEAQHHNVKHSSSAVRDASLFVMMWLILFVGGFWLSSAFEGGGGRAKRVEVLHGGGGGTLGLDDTILSQIPVNVGARVGAAPF